MIAWGYIPTYSCTEAATCTKENNWGWRYLVLTLGAITFAMFLCRFLLFTLYESPKFLVSRGRQEEAVAAVQGIAHKNKKKTWLTEDILNEIGGHQEQDKDEGLTTVQIIKKSFSKFSMQQVTPLFSSKKLGFSSMYSILPKLPTSRTLTNHYSRPPLVLLGSHWNGLHPLQRLPAAVSRRKLHFNLHHLPQLRHHRCLRYPRPTAILVHGRPPIPGAKGHALHHDRDHRCPTLLLHSHQGRKRAAGVLVARVLLPDDDVRRSLRLHPRGLPGP